MAYTLVLLFANFLLTSRSFVERKKDFFFRFVKKKRKFLILQLTFLCFLFSWLGTTLARVGRRLANQFEMLSMCLETGF